MVVVKWSSCSPSTSTIRVRILLTSTVFSVKFVLEKNQNKQKVGWPVFLKKDLDLGTERCGRNLRWRCSPRIKIDYENNLKTD